LEILNTSLIYHEILSMNYRDHSQYRNIKIIGKIFPANLTLPKKSGFNKFNSLLSAPPHQTPLSKQTKYENY